MAPLAQNAVLFLHITTRIPGRAHDGLLSEKGFRAFPTIAVLDDAGEVLVQHQGNRSVKDFVRTVQGVRKDMMAIEALRKKAEKGDKTAIARLLARDMVAGAVTLADARKQLDELGRLSGSAKKDVDAAMAYLEYQEVIEQTKGMHDKELVAGGKFLEMAKDGRIPESKRARYFWEYVMRYAANKGELATFDKALKMYDQQMGELYGENSTSHRKLVEQAEALRDQAKRRR